MGASNRQGAAMFESRSECRPPISANRVRRDSFQLSRIDRNAACALRSLRHYTMTSFVRMGEETPQFSVPLWGAARMRRTLEMGFQDFSDASPKTSRMEG